MKVMVTGSFNPITKGHEDIILRAANFFDEVIVAVFNNAEKEYEFSIEEREALCREVFKNNPKIKVVSSDGMVFELCRKENCFLLLRGVRNEDDLNYEKMMAAANKGFEPRCETLFLSSSDKYTRLSSTEVRRIISENGELDGYVPENAKAALREILEKRKGKKDEK